MAPKNWHQKHLESMTTGQRIADRLAAIVGSWGFITFQTLLLIVWVSLNIYGYVHHWDPYPFVFLNLILGIFSSYSAPIIMMSENRQTERDRAQAEEDFRTNVAAKKEIEELQLALHRIEEDKLNKILKALTGSKKR